MSTPADHKIAPSLLPAQGVESDAVPAHDGSGQGGFAQRTSWIHRFTPQQMTTGALILIAVAMWSAFFYWIPANLDMPLARDQGVFAWVGSVILRGGLPYADAWEVKGPAVHFLYAAALGLFGERETAIRIFDLCIWALAAGAFALLSRGLSGRYLPGLLSAPLLLFFSHADYWNVSQPDLWASIFMMCSLACAVGLNGRSWRYFAAGIFVGIASLIKPFYGAFVLVIALFAWQDRSVRGRKALWLLATATAVPLLAIVVVYSWAHKLPELIDVMLRFNPRVHVTVEHSLSLRKSLTKFSDDTIPSPIGDIRFFLELFAVIGLVDLFERRREVAVALACAVAMGAAFVFVQNKFYYYHYTSLWVFVAALAAAGIAAMVRFPRTTRSSSIVLWGLTLAGVGWVVSAVMAGIMVQATPYWRFRHGELSEAQYRERFCGGNFCHDQLSAAATFVRSHTRPDERIYLWGFDALVYILAERQAPTRFGFLYPLVVDAPEYRQRKRDELMRDLCKNPPAMFLVQTHDGNNLTPHAGEQSLRDFPALQGFLTSRYRPQMRNSHVAVYALDKSARANRGCEFLTAEK